MWIIKNGYKLNKKYLFKNGYKKTIDFYGKVWYHLNMVYVKKPERQIKLRQAFIEKCQGRWGEYELLGEYSNKDTKILFKHKTCGTEFMMTPRNFKGGHGCPKCAHKQRAESLKKAKGNKFLDVVNNSNGEYELKSEYVNYRTPVYVHHRSCDRIFSRVPNTILHSNYTGELCTLCSRERDATRKTYSIDEANARLAKVNPEYEFVAYSGASRKATVRHKECGHIFTKKAAYFMLGDGHCPKCTTNVSRQEKEIFAWLQTLGITPEQSVRDIPNVSEIDLLIREKGVGIEFNGHYWHSAQKLTAIDRNTGKPRMTYAEAKRYHYNKSFWCEKAGIRLIHIWDYEWEDERKQKVLKNIILGALGMLPERYYARNTICKYYEQGCARWQELGEFFENNNIQGNRGGSHIFTLEDKDGRVLMAYKFGRPSGGRAKKLYEYEMVRGASAFGVQVVGGASKLWKHFLDTLHPNSVVYYIDYNYFDGKSVERLGGKFVISQPGVKNYWVETEEVKNRQPAKHAEVKKAIAEGKVLEMWNAGTKTYVFDTHKLS